MRRIQNFGLLLSGLLLTFLSQTPTLQSQQFVAAKNVSPSTNVGNVYASGDINHDGKLDVIAIDRTTNVFVSLLNNGNGTFTEKAPTTPIAARENAALGDVNGDGFLDLVTDDAGPIDSDGGAAGYGQVTVYLGDGTGDFRQSFTANLGADTAELALADVNGDGHLDIITCTDQPYQGTGYVQIFIGDGKGSFTQKGGAQYFNLLAAGDLNGDGKADLIVVGGTQINGVLILLSKGDGTFTPGQSYGVNFFSFSPVVIADFNHDGHKDFAVVDPSGQKTSILLGNGDGTFTIKSQFSNVFPGYPGGTKIGFPDYATAADFNGDGNPDLVTFSNASLSSPSGQPASTDSFGIISVSLGKGDGTFNAAKNYTLTATNFGGGQVAAGDFNGDGHEDILVGGFNAANVFSAGFIQLLAGTGTGDLTAPVNTLSADPFSIVHADFNHDGIQDAAVVNQGCSGCATSVSVFLGTGKGYFAAPKTFSIDQTQGSLAAGDINNDGKLDLVVTRAAPLYVTAMAQPAASLVNPNHDTSVLLGNGDGTFKSAVNSVLLGPAAISSKVWLVDMNRDGKLDLVGDWGVALGKGDGTFQPPKAFPTALNEISGVGVGDLNNDGIQDVVLYDSPSGSIESELGNGTGGFTVKSKFSYPHYVITDLMVAKMYGGTERDIVFCGESVDGANARLSTNLVATVHGNGDGTFGTKKIVPVPNLPVTLAYGDFDRDGKLDVVVNDRLGVEYLRGTGTGSFYSPAQFFPGAATYLQPIDINGDGALDVVGITPIGFERLLNTGKRN